MKRWIFGALIVGLTLFAANHLRAQAGNTPPGFGTVFIDAQDCARNITISRQGAVLAYIQLPKGTHLSAADEHRKPNHLGGGKFEFHGNFELRAMLPTDIPAAAKDAGHMPAAELMSHAPMVMTAQGVDVILEKPAEQ
jgi:hypothetical protein